MAKFSIKNEASSFSVQHRAVCKNDNFKGAWHDNPDDAKAEAYDHRHESLENRNHVIMIVTQQTLEVTYSG